MQSHLKCRRDPQGPILPRTPEGKQKGKLRPRIRDLATVLPKTNETKVVAFKAHMRTDSFMYGVSRAS